MLAIPMCDIFAIAARKPPPAALAGSSAETVFGRFSPVGGTFASALERAVMHTSPY
ncbi:hypothetical protein H4R19_001303 [Coemansia spiralis]|nr:hypothetical protein H4R19_001303 [Coemansia spiralis]